MIASAPGEEFNVAAVHSHWGATDSKISDDVDEASMSYVYQ
jgi:hypothetical protein